MIDGTIVFQGSKFKHFGIEHDRVAEVVFFFHGDYQINLSEKSGQNILQINNLPIRDLEALKLAIEKTIIKLEGEAQHK